ncbi:MAG: TIGR04282 family arsenosugar biosynthesis glycosyltransferase [Flammeovirgaceae bacterium]|nr:TIGR04282 family arsenosugar biosynthesis glycosyltransferase [Flammeovirgaceae bacterium]
MKNDCRLLIFVRNPILGKVKTRLAKDIGEENARLVYNELLARTKEIVLPLSIQKQVCYDSYVDYFDLWENDVFLKTLQKGHTLGERMENAFCDSFAEGCRRVVIIGSDCWELTTDILQEAFQLLAQKDVVIGKAADGGYYLLGLSQHRPALFRGKHWSTPLVFPQTMSDITSLSLTYSLLPTLSDIDTLDDLMRYKVFEKFWR